MEKLAERLESGADIGDFSQNGHFASITQLNMSFDDYKENRGIEKPDEKTKELEKEITLEADREAIESAKKDK